MSRLSNLTAEESVNVGRLKNVNGYGNMSRQQLENIFKAPSEYIPKSIPISRLMPRPRPAIRISPTLIPTPRCTPEAFIIDVDELKKMEMAKTRSIPENTWYQCYDWLISHITGSKFESDARQKVLWLFESKIYNTTITH